MLCTYTAHSQKSNHPLIFSISYIGSKFTFSHRPGMSFAWPIRMHSCSVEKHSHRYNVYLRYHVSPYRRMVLSHSRLIGPHSLATPCSLWHFAFQSVMSCCQNFSFHCTLLFVQYFSKFVGNESLYAWVLLILWLNAETLKRVVTFLFGRLVMCSAHGHSFTRLLLNISSGK